MPTKIEWCDETINPIVGCSKISEGCQNCYAEKMAWRLKCMGIPKYQDVVDRNGWTGKIAGDLEQFHSLPKKPKKVFVVSMGDLFHENVRNGSIAMVFYAMRDYPQHTYMILTKRPDCMAYFLKRRISPNCIKGIPNLWLGVTAENQKRWDERCFFLDIPASKHFVSFEPLLEAIEIESYPCPQCNSLNPQIVWPCPYCNGRRFKWPDWVIAGPETGPGKRECKPELIESLYDQCYEAGIPFFDKTKNNWIAREFPENTGQNMHI